MSSSCKKGFTIIELSLSIAFIAVLSIAVILVITNAISSYHRGLTLNLINTSAMDVVEDFKNAIQNSPVRSPTRECSSVYNKTEKPTSLQECEDDHGKNFVSVVRNASVEIGGRSIGTNDVPVFGAFCTGAYSYIWNSGYFFNPKSYKVLGRNISGPASLTYNLISQDGGDPTQKTIGQFKLLKIKDEQRAVCISSVYGDDGKYKVAIDGDNSINKGTTKFDISQNFNPLEEDPVDILNNSSKNNLAIYDVSSVLPAESPLNRSMFYFASIIIGTVEGGINIKASGDFCSTPNGFSSAIENFDYCAINKFNFAAQASGGSSNE